MVLVEQLASLDRSLVLYGTLGLSIGYALWKRWTKISIAHIPGPEPESWSLGNMRQFFHSQAGEIDEQWHEQFGDVYRLKGSFGEDRLLITDPKALQYIYNTSYFFDKQQVRQEMVRLLVGRGLSWATGETHRRQRKVTSPAFGASEVRARVPLLVQGGQKLSAKWREIIGEKDSAIISVPTLLARALLDVIGVIAFDYEFNSLDDDNNALGRGYQNIISDTFRPAPKPVLIMQSIFAHIPFKLLQLFFDHAPIKAYERVRALRKLAEGVSAELIESKRKEIHTGKGKRDIISLLVKASESTNPDTSLSYEELLAMMMTILSGHETTNSALTWGFYELAMKQDVQDKLRAEIYATEDVMKNRGDTAFNADDLDGMTYTIAFIKEVLRFYPVMYFSLRESKKDQVLPLSKPIKTNDGRTVSEIPIPKGLNIFTSLVVYNRNKDIFGHDADVFNPDRWLENRVTARGAGAAVGIYGNMMTFGSGTRACIGWRVALYEMQAFFVELVKDFKLEPTPALDNIRKEPCMVMVPALEGELDKGSQMPLKVTPIIREDEF